MVTHVLTGSFSGLTSHGAISIAGLKVGDAVTKVVFATTDPDTGTIAGQDVSSNFAPVILVDGELNQTVSSDFSSDTFVAVLEREVLITL